MTLLRSTECLVDQLRLTGQKYPVVEARREFFRQLIERVEAQPGVDAAAGVLIRPLEGTVGWDYDYAVEGQSIPDARRNAISNFESITPRYFNTFGIPLKTGRTFDLNDTSDKPPVAIISESMAVRFFGSAEGAIGKRLKLAPEDPDEPWRSIVGVAGNVRYRELQGIRLDIYLPHAQSTANLTILRFVPDCRHRRVRARSSRGGQSRFTTCGEQCGHDG